MAGGSCRPLDSLRRGDEGSFGAKSAGLGELLGAGIPVPTGFAISTAAFESFVADQELATTIATAIGRAAGGDLGKVEEASREIVAAMGSTLVPAAVGEEIDRAYAELVAAGAGEPALAVRSSAIGEDSEEATFAGQQESYLWVRGPEALRAAVRDCWASLYSPPAISYRAKFGDQTLQPAMGVTVQVMVDAACAGVMFTCNPVSGDPSMVAINAGWGLGLAVVGGEVTPDDYLVSKVTREVVREEVNTKRLEYVPDPSGAGTVQRAVGADRAGRRCLEPESLAALVDIGLSIERHFQSHQDVEWAIARGGSGAGEIAILQSRPVTAMPERKSPTPRSAMSLVMGTFGARTDRG